MSEDVALEVDRLVSVIEQSTKTLYAILAGLEHFKKSVRKTHCLRGHERTPETTYKSGGCKKCVYITGLARAKQREAL